MVTVYITTGMIETGIQHRRNTGSAYPTPMAEALEAAEFPDVYVFGETFSYTPHFPTFAEPRHVLFPDSVRAWLRAWYRGEPVDAIEFSLPDPIGLDRYYGRRFN